MSDNEKLQNMLDNLINQKPEDAQANFHDYLQDKMKDIVGTTDAPEVSTEEKSDEE